MITKIEVSFHLEDRIDILWLEDSNWECLVFEKENEKEAKLKLVELVLKMG
jgi:hypothetical protein